eukprot:CAMPEP_0201489460 /NCGR_PEP_ID=MMETSP0151_2-20130828/22820_1 /ASSEMBLY_ACC=CAM_ASM_000257 /TAXON_ID=200890 /ORGANISM="Paramoeba atlantica, Strain 621/1 / CCAP 1560/9" /LENGTH=98 /DNA_ID=CAMNT_0047875069 /DNA_START=174 /DNA_END=470 /DNA_ORIENTATION=-
MDFLLHGKPSSAITGVQVTATSSLCITEETCVPVDTRLLPCVTPTCEKFPVGVDHIGVQTLIPAYTPSGTYEVKLRYEGTMKGDKKEFACALYRFRLH